MQVNVKDIKVKEGTVKAGSNAGNPWKLIILIGQDGTEFTTFDASVQEVGIGGVIELEPVIKAGKINFTEFKIIQKGQPPAPVVTAKPDMTKEDWADKDRTQRDSIEKQVIFKGMVELFLGVKELSVKETGVYDAALDWALAHFTGTPVQKSVQKPVTEATQSTAETTKRVMVIAQELPPEATKSTTGSTKSDLGRMVFKDAGKLKTAMKDELKMSLIQITAATAGFDLTTESGRKDCWTEIVKIKDTAGNEKNTDKTGQ